MQGAEAFAFCLLFLHPDLQTARAEPSWPSALRRKRDSLPAHARDIASAGREPPRVLPHLFSRQVPYQLGYFSVWSTWQAGLQVDTKRTITMSTRQESNLHCTASRTVVSANWILRVDTKKNTMSAWCDSNAHCLVSETRATASWDFTGGYKKRKKQESNLCRCYPDVHLANAYLAARSFFRMPACFLYICRQAYRWILKERYDVHLAGPELSGRTCTARSLKPEPLPDWDPACRRAG
jgi:hypothetical protein